MMFSLPPASAAGASVAAASGFTPRQAWTDRFLFVEQIPRTSTGKFLKSRLRELYGDPVIHVGELGSGQITKLLNNLLFTANLGTAAAALALASSLGISPERLTDVVSRSSGNSFAFNTIGRTGGLDRFSAGSWPSSD